MEEETKNVISNLVSGKDKKDAGEDALLKIAKERGYTKQGCSLPGALIMALMHEGECPCDRCNVSTCKDFPKGKGLS